MYVTAVILSALLGLVVLAAGAPKVLLKGPTPDQLQKDMGLSAGLVRFIGTTEVAATAGLVIGIFWQPLGVAAAIGLVALFIGAAGFHARAGDFSDAKRLARGLTPIVLGLVSVATAITLSLSI